MALPRSISRHRARYVLGCGGTKLTLSGASIASEQAWNDLSVKRRCDGRRRERGFRAPELPAVCEGAQGSERFRRPRRPDVAGDADPETGYNVVIDGQQTVIGGTSAVAPLWAGLLALINQSLGDKCGLRQSAALCRECRRDIPRHHLGQQRRLFRRPRLGRLHRSWQPRWCGTAGRLEERK